MKLSTKGRYVTRALLDLARQQTEEPTPLKDIARRQDISLSYLEHLVAPLITAGIIRSSRGPAGGIQLVKPPHEIKLSEVIRLVEGPTAPVECIDNPEVCSRSELCVTREIWSELERAITTVLESTTLKDLIERQEKKERAVGLDMEETSKGEPDGEPN